LGGNGCGSSAGVLATLDWLVSLRRAFRVVMVVRPDNILDLPDSLRFLHGRGVRAFEPSLDLWTKWSRRDVRTLENTIDHCAGLWGEWLPGTRVTWFDEKLALLTGVPLTHCARCAFGNGEIAVSPSGRLYPCERLVGNDAEDNPHCLPGGLADAGPFHFPCPSLGGSKTCVNCAVAEYCNTSCRCSNFVRTGRYTEPDGLLCRWNKACIRSTRETVLRLAESENAGVCTSHGPRHEVVTHKRRKTHGQRIAGPGTRQRSGTVARARTSV